MSWDVDNANESQDEGQRTTEEERRTREKKERKEMKKSMARERSDKLERGHEMKHVWEIKVHASDGGKHSSDVRFQQRQIEKQNQGQRQYQIH